MNPIRPHPRNLFQILALCLLIASLAVAQTSTATIKGRVLDPDGDPVGGAEINAVNLSSGNVHQAVSRRDGTYLLAGLRPATYELIVASPAYEPTSQTVQLLIGQSINADFRLSPSVVLTESITVVGQQVVEMDSTQISTNITPAQIEQLPQNNRNFMNFAALAPGVTISDDETRKTFQSGAQSANAVNVFVDGVSFKNDVIQGGVVGQDASRGNPFPQNAVQEFRVLTQNYSAEFQKAGTAVITAVTKSGSNALTGEVFAFYQDNDLVDENPLTGSNPFFERLQTGLSLGGPISRDQAHFFLSYEGNDQERAEIVSLGSGAGNAPASLIQQLQGYTGEFSSDFELGLFFGKLSFQPTPSQIFELSGFMRDETDVRGFGNQNSFEMAEEIPNDVWNVAVRHNYTSQVFFNEASLSMQEYRWNPRPLNDALVGLNYQNILRIGGRDTEQDIWQERLSLRDDLTFSPMEWQGTHVFKVGGVFDFNEYNITKHFTGNPLFQFRAAENYERPFEARFGIGDPTIKGDNNAIGLYLQDEWSLTDQFMLNLGVRWDYESDMFPTDWVTPTDVVQKFSSFVDPDRYFTDGNDRQAIDDMFAPRLGFTYDVLANNRTVVFGGWGRYYDRILFNHSLDERFRLQYTVGTFLFSEDGAPLPDGRPTAAWDPRYLSAAGMRELVALGITGRPEVFLIENDTDAPYTDQWTVGVRQAIGDLVATLSYGSQQSQNGMTFGWGHRNADGTCCRWAEVNELGYAALIASQDSLRTWYEAIYLQLDKPFTSDSRWGGGLSYTGVINAEGIGGDLFSFDFPTVEEYPRRPINNIHDHRLVANVLFGLPLNFNAGTVVTYGSGYRYNIIDQSQGTGPLERNLRGEGEGDGYLTLDLRLEYAFDLGPMELSLLGEAFNITNDEVYNNFNNRIFTLPNVNPDFGRPTSIVQGSQRRFQYGVRLRF
ncbi:MAG TPA: TonB-dependent receptor [Thermoanaerobaculia bacterium]|nr:TonB-dependent receptor [Thermoanaerobaculia bacterium]